MGKAVSKSVGLWRASTLVLFLAMSLGLSCKIDCDRGGLSAPIPWSGYWWPMKPGSSANLFDAGGPFEHYDAYIAATAGSNPGLKSWELSKHDSQSAGSWWGHCHAWAAASILEDEPSAVKTLSNVKFTIGDQKGLLTACYYSVPSDLFVGSRCYSSNTTSPAYKDVTPADFHNTLTKWLGFQGYQEPGETAKYEAIIFDIQPGAEVWNYPVYAFSMKFTPDTSDSNKTHVSCKVSLAEDAVPPDYLGTKTMNRTYTYWVNDTDTATQGEWEGSSINDHPDFIWHPAYHQADAGSPVDYNKVKLICQ